MEIEIWILALYLIGSLFAHLKLIDFQIKIRYQNKKWVKKMLKVPHEVLLESMDARETTVLADFKTIIDGSVSNHLKTFKAALFSQAHADARALEGEATEMVEQAISAAPMRPKFATQKTYNTFFKKHPALAIALDMMPYAQQYLPQQGDGGQQLQPQPSRSDF